MTQEVSKTIPIAERIIDFKSKDSSKPLNIINGWHILKYEKEKPIIHYRCDPVASLFLEGGFHLNSFIESITVSTALHGEKAWFDPDGLRYNYTDCDSIVYYTDHVGINHAITQHDIYWFLLQKPNLIVSPEGVLVFFTDKQIIATVDCNTAYHWIDGHLIDVKDKTIKNIEVCDSYCKVILIDDKKVEQCFSLTFDFNIASYQPLDPNVFEL